MFIVKVNFMAAHTKVFNSFHYIVDGFLLACEECAGFLTPITVLCERHTAGLKAFMGEQYR